MASWVRQAAALALLLWCAGCAGATPLDDYVNKPDPNYGWKDTGG